MSTGKFIWRLSWKLILIVLIETFLAYIASPVLSNQLAMTQMENSNEMYFFVNTVFNARSTIKTICNLVTAALSVTIGLDIHNLVKSINHSKNEKEN